MMMADQHRLDGHEAIRPAHINRCLLCIKQFCLQCIEHLMHTCSLSMLSSPKPVSSQCARGKSFIAQKAEVHPKIFKW